MKLNKNFLLFPSCLSFDYKHCTLLRVRTQLFGLRAATKVVFPTPSSQRKGMKAAGMRGTVESTAALHIISAEKFLNILVGSVLLVQISQSY